MCEYSLANFIFDNMESEGFKCVKCQGRVGEETLTFKNESGEIRTVQFGFTPVKRKNYRVTLSKEELQKIVDSNNEMPDTNNVSVKIFTTKVDFSNVNISLTKGDAK